MPNTPEQIITKAKEAERRHDAARRELKSLRDELTALAKTSVLSEPQKREAQRIARKGAGRRRGRR
jgi:hypothetical protein